MFFKRLAVVFVLFALIVQLTACNGESNSAPSDNSQQATNSQITNSQTTSGEDENNENNSVGTRPDEDGYYQDRDEITSDNNGNTDDFEDDNGKNPPTVSCNHSGGDPYQNMSKTEFYADYKTACCNLDASYRSKHGFLSGSLEVPGQYVTESNNPPKSNGKYVRNTATIYTDNGNTYLVIDSKGNEVMRIHKAGGYVTLEEVAAYMYAFGGSGQIPANYTSKKSGKPSSSIWGEYLRVNHSYFIGDTDRYPYEPELPDISGCGGKLKYYEMDIGTTGTVTPGYAAKPYIDGNKINRGAARIVYARQDLNGNGIYENNEVYVFYTHNHYNDFREYLNYYGGWGSMFGNVTGGGEYSSDTNANPTPYVKTAYRDFSAN